MRSDQRRAGARLGGAVRGRFGGGGMARAAGVTAVLTAAGAGLGLVRDQLMAHMFGAGAQTDAFLVAWTVPEVAATVLIEDAMALLMVPAFSAALARGGPGARGLVRGTLPRLAVLLAALTALLAAGAPYVVAVLAPGLADPREAVACTRLTAATVFTFGLAGYLSAALRAHHRFVAPAAIYLAYNTGIIATLLALHGRYGVQAAAAGVAVGGACMVVVQLPAFAGALRGPRPFAQPQPQPHALPAAAASVAPALVIPVVVFTLTRQAQVLLERFFAAPLPAGAISYLNYAQKIAQLPMVLSLMLCTVTFPAVSRALAEGDRERARRRVERDLTLACLLVLLGAAYIIGCAPAIVHALFQRGEFSAADTAATSSVMRVYALGLLGQCLVGAVVRPYFSAARPTWYPAAAMGGGLLVTAVADAAATGPFGVYGIAAGNAAGITVTAVLLLRGLRTHSVPVRLHALAAGLARIAPAAVAATAAGWTVTAAVPDAWAGVALGGLAVPAAFAALALPLRPRTPADATPDKIDRTEVGANGGAQHASRPGDGSAVGAGPDDRARHGARPDRSTHAGSGTNSGAQHPSRPDGGSAVGAEPNAFGQPGRRPEAAGTYGSRRADAEPIDGPRTAHDTAAYGPGTYAPDTRGPAAYDSGPDDSGPDDSPAPPVPSARRGAGGTGSTGGTRRARAAARRAREVPARGTRAVRRRGGVR